MEKKTDLRVVKTKKALVEAMIQCLNEKLFEDITVQTICDVAMVRRATFYTHFSDKYELFSYTICYIYRKFPSYQSLDSPVRTPEIYLQLIEDSINFLTAHTKFVHSLIESNLAPMMLDIISTEIEKDLSPSLKEDMNTLGNSSISPDLVIHFYIRGIFGAFLWWITENYPISKDELIKQVHALVKL